MMKPLRYLARVLKGEQKTREDKKLMKNSPWVGKIQKMTKASPSACFLLSKAFHFVPPCYNSHSMSGVIWRKE